MLISVVLHLLLLLGFPVLALWYQQKSRLSKWLSAIVLCYLLGIMLRNGTALPINEGLAQQATEASILLALPLLLFSLRFRELQMHLREGLLAFVLSVLAGLISCAMATFLFQDQLPETWKLGGMLVGIFTGGTPNMQAIGLAIRAPQHYIILLNAADIFSGGLYLILLTSVLPPLLGHVMRPFRPGQMASAADEKAPFSGVNLLEARWWLSWGKALLLSILLLVLTLGLSWLIFGNMEQVAFLLLSLTTLSIAASFLPAVQKWTYTYELGEYFLLIFCVALGLQADFASMLAEGQLVLQFTAFALVATVLLHFLLSLLFKIDRDTFLIASTAAVFGPAFVGQIATVINNRQLVLVGIALGLLGYAAGNYLGLGMTQLLYWWLNGR